MNEAEEFWDSRYGSRSRPISPRIHILRRALLHFGDISQKSVLEIGCGDGASSLFLAQHAKKVVAIDRSAVAIDLLREECSRRQITNVEPICCDAFDIGGLGRFDAILGMMILHHIEPFRDFRECLEAALSNSGRAFFWENNSRNPALAWCRRHLVGRFGVPRHGDSEEFPLTPSEVAILRETFHVVQEYPELYLFRLVPAYVLKDNFTTFFNWIDKTLYKHDILADHSYRQYLLVSKRSRSDGD
jgi:SAM-dependent methyltransferase